MLLINIRISPFFNRKTCSINPYYRTILSGACCLTFTFRGNEQVSFKSKCGAKTLGSSRNWHLCPHKTYRAFQDLGRVGQSQGIGSPELAYGPSLIICR